MVRRHKPSRGGLLQLLYPLSHLAMESIDRSELASRDKDFGKILYFDKRDTAVLCQACM
jgi:hypothetical protein